MYNLPTILSYKKQVIRKCSVSVNVAVLNSVQSSLAQSKTNNPVNYTNLYGNKEKLLTRGK